jgi:hypothetical protein
MQENGYHDFAASGAYYIMFYLAERSCWNTALPFPSTPR